MEYRTVILNPLGILGAKSARQEETCSMVLALGLDSIIISMIAKNARGPSFKSLGPTIFLLMNDYDSQEGVLWPKFTKNARKSLTM